MTTTTEQVEPDTLDVPHSRDVEHFFEHVAEAIAKSRYTQWNPLAATVPWSEFSADPARAAETMLYREDGVTDARQVLNDLTASEVIAVVVFPAHLANSGAEV